MTRYRVYLEAVAAVAVEVEAESEDEAIRLAFENTPSRPDMGDWYFPADEDTRLRREDYLEELS